MSESSLIKSTASESDIELYTKGSCHVFAAALNRLFGWRILLIVDNDEHFWEDDADPDNYIPAVVHAYAVDGNDMAWDIRGTRPRSDVRDEIENEHIIGSYGTDWISSPDEMEMYVGCWADDGEEPIERPLLPYAEKDVEEAMETARAVLSGIAGFPADLTAQVAR